MGEDYVVVVEDLRKVYSNSGVETTALNGVNLKVRRGEMLAIVGPSGSGKSTLLNMLGALDKPTDGRVVIDGTDISKAGDDTRAEFRNKKIGFVFQSYNLINRLRVIDNVQLPLTLQDVPVERRKALALKMLREVGLESKAFNKPTQLSGGEQQRVAIARALVTEPSIILADEPTGNLDSKSGAVVVKLLRELTRKGNTVIVVTHNMDVARAADRIVYIRDGKIEKEEKLALTGNA
ncbi:MAG: ABC transporter ATP-binding protein [Candidatus Caldarchaeum sp.]|uniref:ABC transporter ATP-binding protein n=1 Tax=Caldiarchaeum subterraneum TaxID=311458 RepID=A0A7C5QRQ6_CALS0